MSIIELYNKILREHSMNPHNYCPGVKNNPESIEKENSACGDWICLLAQFNQKDVLAEIGFEIEGCAISTASSSIMTEIVKGKTREEVKKISQEILAILEGEKEPSLLDSYSDMAAMKGILPFPIRLKCAALPWRALKAICYKSLSEK